MSEPSTMPSPMEIIQLGTAFCDAKAVLAGTEFGLFTVLDDGPASGERIRERLGLNGRGLRDWLNVLVSLGLLRRDGDHYANTPAAERYLVRGKPTYVGGFLERANHKLYPAWGNLAEALRTGEPQVAGRDGDIFDHMSQQPAELKKFLAMMDAVNNLLGPKLVEAFDWSAGRTVVDVGGARGNLLATVCKSQPHLSGTVFDLPQVQAPFEEHMAQLGMSERIGFHAGDFFTDELPEADILIIGHVLHDWSDEERRMLIGKAYRAVRPGGALLIYDAMLDDELTHKVNLLISLDMLLITHGGAEYTVQECRTWLAEAGFGDVTCDPLGETETLVVARKQAA
ncbi:methyltransferase [Amycolatopsis sp. A133]|uniref:methyltransferase n=1 Tax=Amycolatopsis sp. A133 TaxID=3064472 RepID=UPI0027E680E9|nr:methyltransferase [Amycolatopsis sp. A133]MDQ7803500.1 methyltransferase [Amycolatopsis sp. A133]